MVHIYLGDGKGKTTASLGLALRASGSGLTVYIAQFLKGGKFPSGELKAIKKYRLPIRIERFADQVHPIFSKTKRGNLNKLKRSVRLRLTNIEGYLKKKKFDLVILDEILNAEELGLVSEARLRSLIRQAKKTELILTGRRASPGLIKLADYVSAIKKVRHPFDKKIFARCGIEY